MNVIIHGEDPRLATLARRMESAEGAAQKALNQYREIHLAPIPTRHLPDALTPEGKRGRLLITYGHPEGWENVAERCIDLESDESFLEENARLTALGTLGHILMHNTRALPDLSVGVVGYGRIGRRLVHYLCFLGARVSVYSSRNVSLPRGARLIEVDWSHPPEGEAYATLDVLINTAPTPLLASAVRPEVLDLASGAPIPPHVPHKKLASLPARLYHESAGLACYRAVMRNLNTR